jgi:hypothetical protein
LALRKITTLLLLFSLLTFVSCKTDEAKESAPAGAAAPMAEAVKYESGFHGLEKNADGSSWQWMDQEGVVKLKNTGQDMTLKINGRAPVEYFSKPSVLKLTLNGEPLDEVQAGAKEVEKEYTVPAAKQGGEWSELRLSASQAFVPKDVIKGSNDPRRISFSLHRLTWEAK